MKTNKLLPLGTLALVLAGSGAMIATAQTAPVAPDAPVAEAKATPAMFRGGERDHGRGGDHGERGEHGRGQGGERGGEHGRVGPGGAFGGEMFRTLFDAIDADGDDTITQAEIDAYRAQKLSEVDASGDGALSIEEFDTLYRELTRSRMVDVFQRFDADGDGVIVAEEMDQPISDLIQRLDRDGDGSITLLHPGQKADDAGDTSTDQ